MWTMVVIFGAALAARLALPALPESIYGPMTARALFHAEWMLVATFLVLPLYEVARRSWRLACWLSWMIPRSSTTARVLRHLP